MRSDLVHYEYCVFLAFGLSIRLDSMCSSYHSFTRCSDGSSGSVVVGGLDHPSQSVFLFVRSRKEWSHT
jgi:hypothetical protein